MKKLIALLLAVGIASSSAWAREAEKSDDHGQRRGGGRVTFDDSSRSKPSSSSTRSRSRMQAKVQFVVPNQALGIASEDDAVAAAVTLSFSRGGVSYAECDLALDGLEQELEHGVNQVQAEFKLDLAIKRGSLRVKKGSCDVDLGSAGVQQGIPAYQKGDSVLASVNGIALGSAGKMKLQLK